MDIDKMTDTELIILQSLLDEIRKPRPSVRSICKLEKLPDDYNKPIDWDYWSGVANGNV